MQRILDAVEQEREEIRTQFDDLLARQRQLDAIADLAKGTVAADPLEDPGVQREIADSDDYAQKGLWHAVRTGRFTQT